MRLRTRLGRRRGIRSVIPWLSSTFWRMVSKKGLAAFMSDGVPEAAPATVVEESEKAALGRCLVRSAPEKEAAPSGSSSSGLGWSVVAQ